MLKIVIFTLALASLSDAKIDPPCSKAFETIATKFKSQVQTNCIGAKTLLEDTLRICNPFGEEHPLVAVGLLRTFIKLLTDNKCIAAEATNADCAAIFQKADIILNSKGPSVHCSNDFFDEAMTVLIGIHELTKCDISSNLLAIFVPGWQAACTKPQCIYGGTIFRTVEGTDCKTFTKQPVDSTSGRIFTFKVAPGTKFDVRICQPNLEGPAVCRN